MAARPGATGWVTAVQIGDSRMAEEEKRYFVTLYYANTSQSVILRRTKGGAERSLPPDVEAQHLGDRIVYEHAAHSSESFPGCSLENASNRYCR
jgi:hypothetical protein